MIREGRITFANTETSFSSWQLPNDIAHAFLVAVFTTILSYQVSASCFDILFGLKARGEAKFSSIESVLLAHQSSLIAVWQSLTSSGRRLVDPVLTLSSIKPATVVILFLALAVAPLANLLAITLAIENEKKYSFKDLSFGGLALGVNKNLERLGAQSVTGFCPEFEPQGRERDVFVSRFFVCIDVKEVEHEKNLTKETNIVIDISTFQHGSISVSMASWKRKGTYSVTGHILSGENLYRLHQNLSVDTVRILMKRAETLVAGNVCKQGRAMQKLYEKFTERRGGFSLQSVLSRCNDDPFSSNYRNGLLKPVSQSITMIDNPVALVAVEKARGSDQPQDMDFALADDLTLVVRRESIVSSAMMGILAAVSIIVRCVLKLCFNNDIDLGIEILLKQALHLNPVDSMLQVESKVGYKVGSFGEIGESVRHQGNDDFGP